MLKRNLSILAAAVGLFVALCVCALAVWPVVPAFTYSFGGSSSWDEGVGVLIIAPGGGAAVKKVVAETVEELGDRFPVEIAYGNAEPIAIHVAAETLKVRGVERIIMIPLITSSHSSVMHQTRYILGLPDQSTTLSYIAHPLPIDVPFVLADGMDSSPLIAGALSDRARELSRKAADETVVLVADGASDVHDDLPARQDMDRLAGMVKSQGGFRRVVPVALHDDTSSPSHIKAGAKLRDTVRLESARGRVIVVPVMLAPTGLEKRIPEHLKGLSYSFSGKGLLPHPKIAEWIRGTIDKQLIKLNWERLAGDSVAVTS